MIEETGRVLEVRSGGVMVETIRQSACSSCSAAKGCGQKMLASVGQGQSFEVLATNPRQLMINSGDQVVLGLAETALLKASMLAYLLPLLTMIALAGIGDLSGMADPWVAVLGGLGLFAGLLLVKSWVKQNSVSRCQYHPEILRTIYSDVKMP